MIVPIESTNVPPALLLFPMFLLTLKAESVSTFTNNDISMLYVTRTLRMMYKQFTLFRCYEQVLGKSSTISNIKLCIIECSKQSKEI